MTMLITKFHRLIQSKLLWIFFLVVVIFSFVIWGTQIDESNSATREANSPGKLYGKQVTPEAYREAYMNTYLLVTLSINGHPNRSAEVEKYLQDTTWRRLVTLETARHMGFDVSPREIYQAIQEQPSFQVDGRFSLPAYENFAAGLGLTQKKFEAFMHEQLLIEKVRHMVTDTLLISPDELTQTYHMLTDQLRLAYIPFTTNQIADSVTVSDEQVRAYFDEHSAAFTLPERVSVRYARYKIGAFRNQIEPITQTNAYTFYTNNLNQYIMVTTNLTPSASSPVADTTAVTTNLPAELGLQPVVQVVTQAFASVQADIIERLSRDATRAKARVEAEKLVNALYPDHHSTPPNFEAAAASLGLTVEKTPLFAETGPVPELSVGDAFLRAAFALDSSSEGIYSDAIIEGDSIYVLYLDQRVPPQIPTFEEVAEKVRQVALADAIRNALLERARTAREALLAALPNHTNFTAAAAALDLTAVTPEPFSGGTGVTDPLYADPLTRTAIYLHPGELSDIVTAGDSLLLAYLIDRKPDEITSLASIRSELTTRLARDRGTRIFEAFQDQLLKDADFQPRKTDEEDSSDETTNAVVNEENA